MTDYSAQLERIRDKLEAARRFDPEFKVFGAKKHKYRMGAPISEAELSRLENARSVRLPDDLRAFLTQIGNGGATKDNAAPGPYYGINRAEVLLKSANLDHDPLIEPNMSDTRWDDIQNSVKVSLAYSSRSFATGCAWLVDQGGTYYNLIALRGPNQGRVIYFDEALQKPRFAYEDTFLDWYERWLDEVAAGYLSKGGASWFGMTMGGDDRHLLSVYDTAEDDQTRKDALCGMFKLVSLSDGSAVRLSEIAATPGENGSLALQLLIRFDAVAAAPLMAAVLGDDDADIRNIAIETRRSALELYPANAEAFKARLATAGDHESFASIAFLLIDANESAAVFAPFLDHEDASIRGMAIYAIGKAPDRDAHVSAFEKALGDDSERVVLNALQGMKGLGDPRLIATFRDIEARFADAPTNFDGRNYVLINLCHRKREFGLLPPEGRSVGQIVKNLFKR